jgi:hypothetical protein
MDVQLRVGITAKAREEIHRNDSATFTHSHKRFGVLYIWYINNVNEICREEEPRVVRRCGCGHDDTFLLAPASPHAFQLLVGDTTNECGFPQSTRSFFT